MLIKPLALAGAVAGLLWVRRTVQQRLPDGKFKRFLLWPGEAGKPHPGSDQSGSRRASPQ